LENDKKKHAEGQGETTKWAKTGGRATKLDLKKGNKIIRSCGEK